MDQIAWLAWIDLETTGTNEQQDPIIEFAMVLTRPDLSEETEPYHSVVCFDDPYRDAVIDAIDSTDAVREMHKANGLRDAVLAGEGKPLGLIDQEAREFLKQHSKPKRSVMIAGSGVGHFDRRFIAAQMPQVDAHLWYPAFDVGVVRRMFQAWDLMDLAGKPGAKTHRALDDVNDHIREARHYKTLLEGLS